ncbi:MAG: Beta-barrel assembly-enhancing protease [Acidobacteria bacterium]|nr:Beta-barrel assembly-enhancing protease [Acidobacteriota bacterium]
MTKRFFRNTAALILAFTLTTLSAFAQGSDKSRPQPSQPLDEKNNPALIGKRDINKGQIEFYSVEREVAIGRQLAAEVDRSSRIITDPLINEYVNRVAQNLVLHSDSKVPFTIKVVDTEEVNAFALPGGFLYVNRGLLEAADNEAEVAGVIAHEIAHVAARHGVEQASKGELFNYLSIPLIFMGGIGGYAIRQAVGLAVPLTFLKFSRGAEKEADRLGAQYMWASGYDPNALITFFEKLQAKDKRKPGTLSKVFSTHPMTGDRITEVRELIGRFPDRGEYQVSTSEFNQVKSRIVSASASSRAASRDADARRPTLKRRPQTTTSDDSGDSEAPNRPVLKRRDPSSSDDPSDSGNSTEDTGRPTLKRRTPSDDAEASGSSSTQQEDSTGRPVLKRRDETQSSDQPTGSSQPGSSQQSETPGKPTLKRRTDSQPEKP